VLDRHLHPLAEAAQLGAPGFATPSAMDHVDGVIALAGSVRRTFLEELRAMGKAVVLAGHQVEGFAARSAMPDNAGGVQSARRCSVLSRVASRSTLLSSRSGAATLLSSSSNGSTATSATTGFVVTASSVTAPATNG
jgi:hypothetical protein